MIVADWPALIDGDRAASRLLLHICRFSGFGREAYGGEDIAALLGRGKLAVAPSLVLTSATGAAVLGTSGKGGPVAAFADVTAGSITQLWLLSDCSLPGPARSGVSVPYDPDCDQRGASVAFDATDFPLLATEHAIAVRHAFDTLPADETVAGFALDRLRAVVLRAFSTADGWAALVAVTGATAHGRAAFFTMIASSSRESALPTIVPDRAGAIVAMAAPWTPSVRA